MTIPVIHVVVEGRKTLNLASLKALEAAATPGRNHVEHSACGDEGFEEWQEAGPLMVSGDTPQSNADADFVAAARQAIPELIAWLEREQALARFFVQVSNQNHDRWMACLSVLTKVTSERDQLLADIGILKARVNG
ncbi:hypothetical protein ALP66_00970 [Pseudomonas amygdali pv. photiniae]|uniref:Uncharacterized protein n=1 Tax=Pseudomonas amygdali pv. photiniae TaxID=251724 RepID=A0A658KGQ8_PSEA0|nr:hypothetical protein [Pseudomonas amygdali]RMS54034.1 hypothetical protein ALP66_00970 [Pseudomonas amygdali pv. photiniae]